MNTPFQFPCLTLQQLKDHCPSKAHGRNWKSELAYRDDCIEVIQRTCDELGIKRATQQRAVILLHRYFTTTSSTDCVKMDKWAHAIACLLLSTKSDSNYSRLECIVHAAITQLRKMQGRPMEREYYNPDGTPGNPAFLAPLAQMVRKAETDVLFAVNFALSISAPLSVVGHQLRQLGLTEEAEQQYPDLATKIRAVRVEAVQTAAACCGKGCVVTLLHPVPDMALAAIFRACKANKLQWYLKPTPEARRSCTADENVPEHLTIAQLKTVARDLPAISDQGSSLKLEQPQNDGHGWFRCRGGRWVSRPARRPALIKYEGGIRLSSTATDSSNGEAATAGPRVVQDPSPSPDSANGPAANSNGSSRSGRHVTFGELPPSVTLLQAQFRQRAAQHERLRRGVVAQPAASSDSDDAGSQDNGDVQRHCGPRPLGAEELQQLQAQRERREQQRQELCRQLKRGREDTVGSAAGSDEEDSAMSRPLEEAPGESPDSSSKRTRVMVC